MPTDETPDDRTFEERLDGMYDRYRRQHLEDELAALAQTMEETLLQIAMTEAFFDGSIDIDESVKTVVRETKDLVEAGQYDAVEDRLPKLEGSVQDAQEEVEDTVRAWVLNRRDTVNAMQRLNDRVQRVDSDELQELSTLLEEWDWQDRIDATEADLEERRRAARDYGQEMAERFDTHRDQLFGVYDDTELRPLVERLLDADRLRFDELTETERAQLADSDLEEYVELKLS